MEHDSQARKARPLARGLLDYFPDALAEVSHVSFVGNEKHNPGEPMHWSREKSSDHADCLLRHLIDRGQQDSDGLMHTAKVAWRALALLQTEIESRVVREREGAVGETAPVPGLSTQQTDYLADMVDNGVSPAIAATVVRGVSVPNNAAIAMDSRVVYISGPMRGIPEFNFPAFDEARDTLLKRGYVVLSPADIDRADGMDLTEEQAGEPRHAREFAARDSSAIFGLLRAERGDRLVLLPGWRRSRGAVSEVFLARWTGVGLYEYQPDSRRAMAKLPYDAPLLLSPRPALSEKTPHA